MSEIENIIFHPTYNEVLNLQMKMLCEGRTKRVHTMKVNRVRNMHVFRSWCSINDTSSTFQSAALLMN